MATSRSQDAFPLVFHAVSWTTESAVKWIFCRTDTDANGSEECSLFVSSVLEGLTSAEQQAPRILAPGTQRDVKNLVSFLRESGSKVWPSDGLPPIVWSKLAIQYWLQHGGCNPVFMTALGDWLRESGDFGLRVSPSPRSKSSEKARRGRVSKWKGAPVSMTSFLLDRQLGGHFGQRQVTLDKHEPKKVASQQVAKANREEALKKMLGVNLYETVRSVIDDAIASGSVSKLSRKKDLKSGRFTYTGMHSELCEAIDQCYGQRTQKYKPSTLGRAIRALVVSRKSWPPGTRGRAG